MNIIDTDNKKEWVSPVIFEEDFTETRFGEGDFSDAEGFDDLTINPS